MGHLEDLVLASARRREAKEAEAEVFRLEALEKTREQELGRRNILVRAIESEVHRLARLLTNEDWSRDGQIIGFTTVRQESYWRLFQTRYRLMEHTDNLAAISIFKPSEGNYGLSGVVRSDGELYARPTTRWHGHPKLACELSIALRGLGEDELRKISSALRKARKASAIPVIIDLESDQDNPSNRVRY